MHICKKRKEMENREYEEKIKKKDCQRIDALPEKEKGV